MNKFKLDRVRLSALIEEEINNIFEEKLDEGFKDWVKAALTAGGIAAAMAGGIPDASAGQSKLPGSQTARDVMDKTFSPETKISFAGMDDEQLKEFRPLMDLAVLRGIQIHVDAMRKHAPGEQDDHQQLESAIAAAAKTKQIKNHHDLTKYLRQNVRLGKTARSIYTRATKQAIYEMLYGTKGFPDGKKVTLKRAEEWQNQ
tara:strand:- start:24559 stop:25161 length:603 start_codon:yes stop_codon:yes gene_type:complete